MTKKQNPVLMRRQRQKWFRIAVQLLFFTAAPSVYHSAFTGVKNAFSAFGQGLPLEMTAFSVQLLLVMGYTVLFGRFFCGWACAFGAVNDWVYQFSQFIQKKTKISLPKLPEKIIFLLQWMKYAVLALVLWLCFSGKGTIVSENSPWTVFSLLRSGKFDQITAFVVGLVLLFILIFGMAVQERFFCQFFCPMGAVFSLLPSLPFLRLKRNVSACPAKCGACQKVCPVGLLMEEDSMRQGECIRCGRCSGICPRGNISTLGVFKGDELWPDGIKAVVLLVLIWLVR